MANTTEKLTITTAMRKGYKDWMSGTPYGTIKKRVGKPLMAVFVSLSGKSTWKQCSANRKAVVRALRAKANGKQAKRPSAAKKIRRVAKRPTPATVAVASA